MESRRVVIALTVLGMYGIPLVGQSMPLDSLLRAHSYDLTLRDGRLGGGGLDFLLDASRTAQFVAIAEEHNVRELNHLAAALFQALHETHGFQYLALEQGSVITSWMGSGERRGDREAIARLAARYPVAPTFATDEELWLIGDVGSTSSAAGNPIWGVDQEFGALHILDRLAELAPDSATRERVEALASEVRPYESDRSGDTHYLSERSRPEDVEMLPAMFRAPPGSEADVLLEALLRTVRIYHNFALARQGLPTAYENGREREESMKHRFMEQYRNAQTLSDSLPRVLAKLGHWHVYRGIFRANVPTFGNFLSEFSISNGMDTFIVSTYVVDGPEDWRNSSGPIAEAAGEGMFTMVDLRPLRPLAHQKRIADLSDDVKAVLFMVDAALIIRGGRTGAYDIVKGAAGSR